MKRRLVYRVLKRGMDLSFVGAAAVLLGLPLLTLALIVRWRLGAPVFFRQWRGGLNGSRFELFKFRSMTDERDTSGQLLPDAARLTPFGRWLRSSSLDELPSLWNILKGEMSLVGPRPLLAQYLERYRPQHARRHEVKPGLTGWAQVNGRNDLPFSKRFELDVWYVDHASLWLDARIVVITALRVLKRKGIGNDADFRTLDDVGLIGATASPMASPSPAASSVSKAA